MLSVIICTYNREKYIYDVLKSIAENDFSTTNYEIILVNNNSTDNTEQESKRFQQDFPQVNLRYFIEKSQGISYARNRGVAEATHEIICFIDDDETVKPDYLQVIADFFTNYPDAALCGGPVEPVYEAQQPAWLSHYILRPVTGYYNKGKFIHILAGKDYPGTGHASLRKELFNKYGLFNTDLGRKGTELLGAEDKEFFLKVIEAGEKCYYLPQAVIYHHIPAEKLTVDFFKRIAHSIGVSERTRTKQLSQKEYIKRLCSELVKWGGTLVLFIFYLLDFHPSKGTKLISFRRNVTKGLLGY